MEDANRVITLALTGDVMLGRHVNEYIRALGPYYPWGTMQPYLSGVDLVLCNLECALTRHTQPWTRTPKVFHFRADPAAVAALIAGGVDFVSLANNHTLDFEEEGLLETLSLLDASHIAHAGAGRNAAEAARPALLEAGGIRIAVVTFTDNEPLWQAAPGKPGINYLSVARSVVKRLAGSVGQARRAGADLVFVSAHWGPNMRERPTERFRGFARAVLDAGADLFFGHSAHVFQGIEIYRDKPILYDLGDFVDDYAVDEVLRNDEALLCVLRVNRQGVSEIELIPALIEECQVSRAEGDDFARIACRIRKRSAEMGTEIDRRGGRLVVRRPSAWEAQPA